MATNQRITDFYLRAQNVDFARQFQFRLQKFGSAAFGPENLVYVESASLPGRAITNIPVPFMGLQFNIPGTASYPGSDSWQVTFRCDTSYNLRAMLEDATFNTFDDSTSTGSYWTPPGSQTVEMNLIDKNFTTVRQYVLIGAYVTNVGEATYDIGDSGNIVKITATVAYQYWRTPIGVKPGADFFNFGGSKTV
jgi:hypothetical protein